MCSLQLPESSRSSLHDLNLSSFQGVLWDTLPAAIPLSSLLMEPMLTCAAMHSGTALNHDCSKAGIGQIQLPTLGK